MTPKTGITITGLLVCALLLIALAPANGQVRKYSNEFLSIGVGARGMAMSGAQVASVDDVTAGYWNPAGLAQVKYNFQGSFMHAEYFAGIAKYDYAAVGRAIDDYSSAAFSVIRFGVDDIPNTTELIDAGGNIVAVNHHFTT